LSFINSNWEHESILLATKRFRPSPRLERKGADVLKTWLIAVLKQFGLSLEHIIGSVTDKGPDVWRLCNSLLQKVRASLRTEDPAPI
jgi:hypothetical protein